VKDGEGAGRRRKGARANRSVSLRGMGLAAGGPSVANVRSAGSSPDGGMRVRSTSHAGGSWVHEPRRRNSGLANVARWLGSRRFVGSGLVSDTAGLCERPDPERSGGANSRGEKAQESTDPAVLPWPGYRIVARTDSRGEQSFEAGVPAAYRRARRGRDERPAKAHSRVCPSGWSSGREKTVVTAHASRFTSGWAARQRAGAAGKAIVKLPVSSRRRQSNANPQGRTKARESGYGSPGRESSGG
jgi:hypothetical protein